MARDDVLLEDVGWGLAAVAIGYIALQIFKGVGATAEFASASPGAGGGTAPVGGAGGTGQGTQSQGNAGGSVEIFGPMKVSAFGQNFIKQHEEAGGLPALAPYPDEGKYAIGWGHDIIANDPIMLKVVGVVRPAKITTAQAQQIFDMDMANVARDLNGALKRNVTQNQFDALADLVFNVGVGGINRMLTAVNNGQFQQAARLFAIYNHAGGSVSKVLTARRKDDADLFSR